MTRRFTYLRFACVLLSFWGCATAELPIPGSAREPTYVNPTHGWSVSYPQGWSLDGRNPRSVVVRQHPNIPKGGVVTIHTITAVIGKSLDEVADTILRIYPASRYVTVSRRRITLSNDIPAIEAMHHIGTGVVGKSRKVIAVVKDRAFFIDAETYLDSWEALEPYFNQIVNSFTVQ